MGSDLEQSKYPVYEGVWTNWSRGRVLGATLTLNRQDADLLIAFTAFFVSLVATRVWRIICFIVHRIRSTDKDQRTIHHQHQVILRNASTPEDGFGLLLKLSWVNRRSNGRLAPLSMAIVAALCIAAFTVAGGYSSQVSTALGDEVLIESANCRSIVHSFNISDPSAPTRRVLWFSEWANNAANYAQQCYSTDNSGLVDCRRFVTKRITSQIDTEAACPFEDGICRNSSGNMRIDSGYLDSQTHFGINTPPHQRIQFRNVLHCAPLSTTKVKSERKSSLGLLTVYNYGSLFSINGKLDYVYAAPSVESQYTTIFSEDVGASYLNFNLQALRATFRNRKLHWETSNFAPAESLTRTDAELYLVFLSGDGVLFFESTEDAWYQIAQTPIKPPLPDAYVSPPDVFLPLEPASPLGCTDQYQFCNPAYQGGRACGPLTGLYDAIAGAAPLFDTSIEEYVNDTIQADLAARFFYFLNTLSDGTTPDILQTLGPASLSSQVNLSNTAQSYVADNQWQLDVVHWWDILMAGRQSLFLDAAYTPDGPDVANYAKFTSPAQVDLCHNQKMRTTTHASFSIFGLLFTFIAGFLLVLYSYIQEPLSALLYKKKGRKPYQNLEWTTNATLQLHRLAHEEAGWGTWSDCTESVPVTTKDNDVLGLLDILDPKHPRICPPVPKTSDTSEIERRASV